MQMIRITDNKTMRRWAGERRASGARICLVPTMGALHEGHLALVRRAAELGDEVVVSIFVNPIQFNSQQDLNTYPRDLERDVTLLERAGVTVLFAPQAAGMYPAGFQTHVDVEQVTTPLCGVHRPGHFRGVATVVTKLFHLVHPHIAVFGEKDYQQLVTIRRMVADLDFGIEIVGVQTVRERDGLALSSRNSRLDDLERTAARCVPRALHAAIEAAAGGERTAAGILGAACREVEREPRARLEYAELRDPDSLEKMERLEGPGRLAMAVWIGDVRLIDNCLVTAPAAARDGHAGAEVAGDVAGQSAAAGRNIAAMSVRRHSARPPRTGGPTR